MKSLNHNKKIMAPFLFKKVSDTPPLGKIRPGVAGVLEVMRMVEGTIWARLAKGLTVSSPGRRPHCNCVVSRVYFRGVTVGRMFPLRGVPF